MTTQKILGVSLGLAGTFLYMEAKPVRPNVILIVTDDMGLGDISPDAHLEMTYTPNLQRFARRGVVCTQGYASASMSLPSRVGLMTGCYPATVGAYRVNTLQGVPEDRPIISEYMHTAGFKTGVFGKWHVGGEFQEWQRPENKGYDRTFYWFDSTHDYWKADTGRSNAWGEVGHAPIFDQGEEIPRYDTGYLTTDIAYRSLDFVRENKDKPFFMYVPHHSVHVPLQVNEAIFNKYKELGYDHNTTVTRGMIEVLDNYIGQLLDLLEEYDIADNTLIIFTSDNGGGEPDGQLNDVYRGGKFTYLEGGLRVPFIVSWPAALPQNKIYGNPVMNIDLLPTILASAGIELAHPVDGVNLLPYLKGENVRQPHDILYWSGGVERKADFAMRQGDWKVVSTVNGVGLFNLAEDPMETTDLQEKHPAKFQQMMQLYEKWHRDTKIQVFSEEVIDRWHHAQDSVRALGKVYEYSSTFGDGPSK